MEFYKDCYDIITDPLYNKITSLELITTTKCQNACKYCYRVKNQQEGPIIGMPVPKAKMYIENAIEMGLVDNKYMNIEIFGGEPIIDIDYIKDLLNLVKNYTNNITITTNGRILENIKDHDIDEIINAADGKVFFSLSVDSPFQENINRPLSTFGKMQGFTQNRNWERLLYLSKKYKMGFHPMLSFETADKWYDTWEYFINNEAHCYLLEVRHPLNKEQMFEAVYQLSKIKKEIIKRKLKDVFNTTTPSYISRGVTCSAQTTLGINSDGCVYFCHRLMNERFKLADLNTKEIDISKFVMWKSLFHNGNAITCMSCPIRKICGKQCLGAIFEYWGSNGCLTIPIPSICQYILLKYYIFSCFFDEWKKHIDMYSNKKTLENAVLGNFGENFINNLKEKIESV